MQQPSSPYERDSDPGPTGDGPIKGSSGQISMKKELQRKLIHLTSLAIPIACIWVSRETALWVLAPLTLLGLAVEFLRTRVDAVDRFILNIVGPMLRPHETRQGKGKVSGATWVLLSATLCVLIFPREVMVTSFAVLIVSDTAAALIGRPFGRHRFLSKSVEGSLAFVVSAVGVVVASAAIFQGSDSFIFFGAIAALIAALVEAVSDGARIDDNLTIPLSFGMAFWGLGTGGWGLGGW